VRPSVVSCHCSESFNFVFVKVYFLIGLNWLRLSARKVLVELKLSGVFRRVREFAYL